MRRLMAVLVVVLIGTGVVEAGRHPTLQNPQGYRRVIGRGRHPTLQNPWGHHYVYRSRPVVQVGVGYGSYGSYGYDYGYSRGPAGYPERSLFDFLTGETDRKALGILGKDQDFRQEQERIAANRETNREIFANANQRGKIQHLEDANKRLQQENAELKKELSEIKKMIQKLLAEKGK